MKRLWITSALIVAVFVLAAVILFRPMVQTILTSSGDNDANDATGYSGADGVTLEISAGGGADFTPVQEAPITQVNTGTDAENLFPVSTADLKTFFYRTGLQDETATFALVQDEQNYYHGRVYIRAKAADGAAGTMRIYFDESEGGGGALSATVKGMLNNAARLGLTFNGQNPKIYSLSQAHNPEEHQVRNTYLNGTQVDEGSVLAGEAGNVYAVPDPSTPLEDARISFDGEDVVEPSSAVAELKLNTVYAVDVFYYLEGCDPDCSDAVSLNASDLHLAFYGIMEETGDPLTVTLSVNGRQYPLETQVTKDCAVYAAAYDPSGKMLAWSAEERSADLQEIQINLNIPNPPPQYSVKLFCVDTGFKPLCEAVVMDVK